MKHHIHTEIDIEAAPEAVWRILTDLKSYSEWNPFVVSSRGTVSVGEPLTNRLQPVGGKPRTFKPRVTIVDPPRTFEWLGHLGLPGIVDGVVVVAARGHQAEAEDAGRIPGLIQVVGGAGPHPRYEVDDRRKDPQLTAHIDTGPIPFRTHGPGVVGPIPTRPTDLPGGA